MDQSYLASIEQLNEHLKALMDEGGLSELKQSIIRLRYGVDGQAPKTLKEIAKALGVKPKILLKEVEEVDRAIFNYLKNRI